MAAALSLPARTADAAPSDSAWRRGLALVKQGNCAKAVPLLEEAESEKHRPVTAYALAGCYVKGGELLAAADIYHALSEEKVSYSTTRDDKAAIWNSKKKAADLDAKIPTISFETADTYDDLEVEIDGVPVKNPSERRRVLPNVKVKITARARGRAEIEQDLTLQETERRVVRLKLAVASTPDASSKRASRGGKGANDLWLGVRGRGLVIPSFLMNAFGEGGRTLFIPGADLTLTTAMTDADLVIRAGYSSYRMSELAFKLNERPNTEYEMIESDLQSLSATVSIIWAIPLDKPGRFHFRIGGGIGVGVMFAGDLYRTQAYPLLGPPDDPASYVQCKGPNSPAGQFRYCNQLDKDAKHYNGYTEPNWFEDGARPLIYPWLAIPELGFSWRATPATTIDLDLAFTISGVLGALGVRFSP